MNDDELQRRYIQAAIRGVSSFHLTLADSIQLLEVETELPLEICLHSPITRS